MSLSCARCRPLRSKRAMISPVRRRANASGLTRIRVRSIYVQLLKVEARRGRLAVARGRPPADASRPRDVVELRLAVGAELPAWVQRLAACQARVAQLARAARAAQELLLDLVVALRAEHVVQVVQSRLGGLHLELALADVVEVLRRPDDDVEDRPHEREQR